MMSESEAWFTSPLPPFKGRGIALESEYVKIKQIFTDSGMICSENYGKTVGF
jgi:hypothetical protein